MLTLDFFTHLIFLCLMEDVQISKRGVAEDKAQSPASDILGSVSLLLFDLLLLLLLLLF